MRRPLLRLALLAGTVLAWPLMANASTENRYSGITSMTFQNGVLPTTGYAGISDARIKSADADRNFGAGTLLKVGGASATGGVQSFVMSADLSALPDSAIIVRARLWLYQVSRVTSSAYPIMQVWRIYRPFTVGTGDSTTSTTGANGVSYNYRISGTAWSVAGAKGMSTVGTTDGTWSSKATLAAADTSVTTTAFSGYDTLDAGAPTGFDTPVGPVARRVPKGGSAAGDQYYKQTGWVSFDITNIVRAANSGAYAVNGFQLLVSGDDDAYGATGLMIFPSSDYVSTIARYVGKVYRPKIVVEYFDPTSGSSGSGGRRVIGNGPGGLH